MGNKKKAKRIDHLLVKPTYSCFPNDDDALHFRLDFTVTSPKLGVITTRNVYCWRHKDIDKANFETMFDHLVKVMKCRLVTSLYKEGEQ